MSEKKSTNLLYDELVAKMLYPMLLFMPGKMINELKKNKEFKILLTNTNVLLAIENIKYNFFVTKKSNLTFIMGKGKLLKNNLFELIDCREWLTKVQFEFLLKNYKQQVDNWNYISEVLLEDAKNTKNDLILKNRGYIKYQATTLLQHKKDIEELFLSSGKSSDYNELGGWIEVEEQQKATSLLVNETNKQQELITTLEADNYLLEKVFGVKNHYR